MRLSQSSTRCAPPFCAATAEATLSMHTSKTMGLEEHDASVIFGRTEQRVYLPLVEHQVGHKYSSISIGHCGTSYRNNGRALNSTVSDTAMSVGAPCRDSAQQNAVKSFFVAITNHVGGRRHRHVSQAYDAAAGASSVPQSETCPHSAAAIIKGLLCIITGFDAAVLAAFPRHRGTAGRPLGRSH